MGITTDTTTMSFPLNRKCTFQQKVRALFFVAALCFTHPVLAQEPVPTPWQPTTTADELHDLMLSAMIHYRSGIYMPSKELALYCEAFRGEHHKKSCAQDMEKVVAGESAARALITRMDANPADLPVDYEILFIGPELNDMDEAQLRTWQEDNPWFAVVGDLVANRSQDDLDCGKDYSCTVIFKLDMVKRRLLEVEVVRHRQPR